MDWLHCLLWVTLTSTSAYNYNNNGFLFRQADDGNPTYNRPVPRRYGNPSDFHRRLDHYYPTYDSPERTNERLYERVNERPYQRPSERSIAVDSGVQRVQEEERNRLSKRPRIDDFSRIENGSYKIVNYPSIGFRGRIDDDKYSQSIKFPGPTSGSFTPEVPDSCKNEFFCEEVPNYPTEHVEKLVEESGEVKNRLQVDVLDEPEIAQRIGPFNTNIELCTSKEKLVYPSAAPATDGKWYFIVNKKNDPLQALRVEICDTTKSGCGAGIAYFQEGYTATCQQKYVVRKMAALDTDGKINYNLNFHVPSCCSCVLERANNNK